MASLCLHLVKVITSHGSSYVDFIGLKAIFLLVVLLYLITIVILSLIFVNITAQVLLFLRASRR